MTREYRRDRCAADFQVRQIIPQAVSGRVDLRRDDPLAGVTVTLHLPGGGTKTTTTEADGSYLFDNNPAGDGYFVCIDVPDGYTADDQRPAFDIATESRHRTGLRPDRHPRRVRDRDRRR